MIQHVHCGCIYPKEIKFFHQWNTRTPIFGSTIHNCQDIESVKVPIKGWVINKMQYLYPMEDHSDIKRMKPCYLQQHYGIGGHVVIIIKQAQND